LVKERTSSYWKSAMAGAEEEARKDGVELTIKGGVSVDQIAAQSMLLDVLAQQNPDVLAVSALAPDLQRDRLRAMAARGMKIVAVDVPLPDVTDVFVGQNQVGMSEAAARCLASLVGDTDEVAIFKTNAIDLGVLARERKAVEILQATHPAVKIDQDVFADPESGAALQHAHFLLAEHPGVRAIFASTTASTMAMIQALEETGRGGQVKLVGFGVYLSPKAAEAIAKGVLSGWLAQEPRQVGIRAVQTAAAWARGDKPTINTYADYLLVTQANLNDPKTQALLGQE